MPLEVPRASPFLASAGDLPRWQEFCQLSVVLGGGCDVEFVTRSAWSAQSETIESLDPLQMREQHLHLLSKLAGDGAFRSGSLTTSDAKIANSDHQVERKYRSHYGR
ncbi:hypothetical protein Q669_31245 [Labrenzia sp. C1B10]|nr:hypothetical protein Q669_31245 [Labrenzia sp. C1B10]ERS02348.1 hypothetical protein Q675_32155 [Labrenzia sp. C1B70]